MTGTTVYKGNMGTFSNIWLIRLAADGRCKEFREWFLRKESKSLSLIGKSLGVGLRPPDVELWRTSSNELLDKSLQNPKFLNLVLYIY